MIYRLLNIIYVLMKKGTVTAGELAERFEVSVRTIYRDVESLNLAGIPVYARKGKNGGICLMETFVLDKLLVSEEEQQQILAALVSLRETGAEEEEEILKRLGDFFRMEPVNWVAIDFSDWSGRRNDLFVQIKKAILGRHVMTFDYYGRHGEMRSRTVEPVQLLFKEYTWYVKAFCRTRQDERLFKVLRMKRIRVLEETFDRKDEKMSESLTSEPQSQNVQSESMVSEQDSQDIPLEITLWIDKGEAYRIYDRFEEDEITILPSGDFEIHMKCYMDDWVYGLILSFGPAARVLEPRQVREEIGRRIRRMAESYGETE
ncbi:MAG: YafY family transcriptional regulator [Lachnospiraceae bacterium]|nr:YafY family transcriptional regulator [Lachnospiraceae bacterium]